MVDDQSIATLKSWAPNFRNPVEQIIEDLKLFELLLIKWQKVQNLVSRETLNQIWERHFLDSLQLVEYIGPGAPSILDIGSGGGFPVVPMAIACRTSGTQFYLVESNRRKVSFLRTVSRELNLDLHVHACRVQELDLKTLENIDYFTSRATAQLNNLLEMVFPFWAKETVALFQKGREFGAELLEARTVWQFDVICIPSKVGSSGVILEIRNLEKRI